MAVSSYSRREYKGKILMDEIGIITGEFSAGETNRIRLISGLNISGHYCISLLKGDIGEEYAFSFNEHEF